MIKDSETFIILFHSIMSLEYFIWNVFLHCDLHKFSELKDCRFWSIGALQCYLKDLGFDAPTMDVWKRPDGDIVLNWASPTQAGKFIPSCRSYAYGQVGAHRPARIPLMAHRTVLTGRCHVSFLRKAPKNP